jgi:hypothetical protein
MGITNLLGSNGATYPGFNYTYNTSLGTFVADWTTPITVGPYTNQASGGVDLTATGYFNTNPAFMVIPKTDPSSFLIECNIDNPDVASGVWAVTVYCPKDLNKFSGGVDEALCTEAGTMTYWTCSVEPGGDGTNTLLGLGDWVFLDPYGVTSANTTALDIIVPIEDGDSVIKCVTISPDGVITNILDPCSGGC